MNPQQQRIAEVVAGMFYRDEPEEEIREWLATKKMITGEAADFYINYGLQDKRKEVRKSAIMRLIFAGIGLSFFVGYLLLQYFGGFILVGAVAVIVWGLGLTALGIVLLSLFELCSGRTRRHL